MTAAALDPDELAGVVDLFGALTRGELERALSELAYRRGEDADDAGAAVDRAVREYFLVEVDVGGESVLAAGPVAFPTLPEGASDLPHILDVEERDPDRAAVARATEERLRADAARAVAEDDEARMTRLVDVTYDLESWGPADAADVRERLDAALEDGQD